MMLAVFQPMPGHVFEGENGAGRKITIRGTIIIRQMATNTTGMRVERSSSDEVESKNIHLS